MATEKTEKTAKTEDAKASMFSTEEVINKIKELQDLVQETIDNGANTVEKVHKQIANMPFDFLKKININGEAVNKVQDFQDKTIGDIYEFIRTMNTKVNEIATNLLNKKA